MRFLPYLAIVVVLLYGLYNAYTQEQTRTSQSDLSAPQIEVQTEIGHLSRESYITHVILYGSSRLHFKPDEVMEAGFASREDAPKIACYVEVLAGRKRSEHCPADAPMYYSSNCAGCHGEDAKGLHGTYPDLTRDPLLGIQSLD